MIQICLWLYLTITIIDFIILYRCYYDKEERILVFLSSIPVAHFSIFLLLIAWQWRRIYQWLALKKYQHF